MNIIRLSTFKSGFSLCETCRRISLLLSKLQRIITCNRVPVNYTNMITRNYSPLCCLCYDLLAERARPYLLTTDAHASTDYINAVYIDVRIDLLPILYGVPKVLTLFSSITLTFVNRFS